MPHHRDNTPASSVGGTSSLHETMEKHDPNATACCAPTHCSVAAPIRLDALDDAVKVVCNNEHCHEGSFMHRACFEAWEQSVLTYLRSTGRARSWSEKQRLQNLWTKKGYDLAFKACGCKCAKGHLRKDLDWTPPATHRNPDDDAAVAAEAAAAAAVNAKKKRSKKRRNDKPLLLTAGGGGCGGGAREGRPVLRVRTNSVSSTGSSPPLSSSAESPSSPTHSGGGNGGTGSSAVAGSGRRTKSRFEFFSDRGSSLFSRRADYAAFNTLPRHKINAYHIKMEDDGSHGNDDTRCFILSNLAAAKTSKTACVLCHVTMLVFDRYPLVDGTFFLSPRQHTKYCVPVKVDGGEQYLCAVCMGCLEGWAWAVRCRWCGRRWDGSSLILGTMYSYDIFAATPCCADRLRCNHCHQPVLGADCPQRPLAFFSDYSHRVPCPHCAHLDFHFVKPLATYAYRRE